MTQTKKKTRKKAFTKNQVNSSKIKIGKDKLTVHFPAELANYLNLESETLYWIPINGTVQLTGTYPCISIPILVNPADVFRPV
jgi:hypothetical protein